MWIYLALGLLSSIYWLLYPVYSLACQISQDRTLKKISNKSFVKKKMLPLAKELIWDWVHQGKVGARWFLTSLLCQFVSWWCAPLAFISTQRWPICDLRLKSFIFISSVGLHFIQRYFEGTPWWWATPCLNLSLLNGILYAISNPPKLFHRTNKLLV